MTADALKDLAYSLVGPAWPGLDNGRREDVIDTLSFGEYVNALEVLLDSTAVLDQDLVDKAKAVLAANPI